MAHDPPLRWTVHVEMPGWRTWSPWRRRRLERALERDERVIRVAKLAPIWYPAVRSLVPLRPYVKVEVPAVGEGEAYRFASGSVGAALREAGVESEAEPWIISTDGSPEPEHLYEAARRKHGARWQRPS